MGSRHRRLLMTVSSACGIVYIIAQWIPLPAALAGPAGYACIALLPGLALAALLGGARLDLEAEVSIIGLGPVVAGIVVALPVLAGVSVSSAARAACVAFAVAAAAATAATRRRREHVPAEGGVPPRVWVTAGVAVALLLVFPFLGEVSRMRSDAWFHSAVASEVAAFGLPPTDPYFAGMPLQYMWLYHVYIAAMAAAAGVDQSWAMALINLQALTCLVVAVFATARALRGAAPGAAISSVFALVGLNCLFWAFLPLKLLKAAFGQVKGWDEVARQLCFLPLNAERARAFVSVGKSQPFLLDKFIVATAFSLGICLAVAFYFFAYRFVESGTRRTAALASVAMAGLVLYHTPTAIAASAAAAMALVFCAATSRDLRKRAFVLALCMAAVGLLAAPYLYSVSSGKETEQLIPFGVSILKTAAVLISCAAALLLGAPWVARFLTSRGTPQYFYGVLAICAVAVSFVIALPGPNVYDKPPYFAFLPLAPLAGWSLHALYHKGATRARRAAIAALCGLAIAPNTVLLYAAYVVDTGPVRARSDEKDMYRWIRDHTPRDALFLENNDRVGIVVLGPRRLIWGHDSYAHLWGYKRSEMDRRRSLRDRVFSGRSLSRDDAEELAGFGNSVYVVVRREDFPGSASDAFGRSPYLSLQYSDDSADIYRVRVPAGSRDTNSGGAADAPAPR